MIAHFFNLLKPDSFNPSSMTTFLDVYASCEELINHMHTLNRHREAEKLRELCGLKQPKRPLGFSQRCNTIVRFTSPYRDRIIEDAVKKILAEHSGHKYLCLPGKKQDTIITFLFAMLFHRDKENYRNAALHVLDVGLVIDITKRDGTRILCRYALSTFFDTDALFCGTPTQLEHTIRLLIKQGRQRDKRNTPSRVIEALVPDRL
ncbi:MAG: hypothetical protein KGO83_05970 [Paenibacillaceae bacterium]|nr:hypothetical protein [Paenibacillaceae bacterium]